MYFILPPPPRNFRNYAPEQRSRRCLYEAMGTLFTIIASKGKPICFNMGEKPPLKIFSNQYICVIIELLHRKQAKLSKTF